MEQNKKRFTKKSVLLIGGLLVLGGLFLATALHAGSEKQRHQFIQEFIQYKIDRELDKLDLTDEQKGKTDRIRAEIRHEVQDAIRNRASSRRLALLEFSKKDPDPAVLRAEVDKRTENMKNTSYRIIDLLLEFHETLDDSQREKLMEIIEDYQENFRSHLHGRME